MVDISNWISRPITDPKFIELTKTVCKFNIETGPWIAGGCVRKLWQGIEWINEDVDIFFSTVENFDLVVNDFEKRYAPEKYHYNADDIPAPLGLLDLSILYVTPMPKALTRPTIFETHQTDNATAYKMSGFDNIVKPGQDINLQFISRSFTKTPTELLCDFDWTICQFISDGITMWATPEAVRDLETRRLQLVHNTTRPITFNRIVKYLTYGFDATDDIMMKMMEFLATGNAQGVEDDYK